MLECPFHPDCGKFKDEEDLTAHLGRCHTDGCFCWCGNVYFGSEGFWFHCIKNGGAVTHLIAWKLGAQ